MDAGTARIRVCLNSGEFEIEGPQSFVESYKARFEHLIDLLSDQPLRQRTTPEGLQAPVATTDAPGIPDSFGEYYHLLPKNAAAYDKVLVAAHYVQTHSPDGAFTTKEANALLTKQGVKVGNASQCVRTNENAKRVFRWQKKYRVSDTGIEYVGKLRGIGK